MQFDGFNSLFLYRRWYRCFTTLDAFCIDNGVLERKNDLTVEEFHSHYDGRKPILLTDLAKSWPAKTKWTFEQLLVKYGDVTFRISQRSSKKITMKFKDYISYMKLQHDEDPLYIFDDKFGEAAPELLEDYIVPHLFQEDWFDVLDDQRPPFRWLIIGPERSGASWHVDPALTSAWNTLLSGRKRWALYPPGRVPAGVTVHVNEEDGDVNIEGPTSLQWWLDVYPLLADHDKPLECIQLPGETISVPSGWWHCVLNLESTIAVTQNFVNTSNFEYVCLDMAPGHIHKGVSRAGLIAVGDKGFEALNSNVFSGTNKLNYPDMTRKEKRLKVSESVKEPHRHDSNWTAGNGPSQVCQKLQDLEFSYDVDFLAIFLVEERDHYNSTWSPGNCIGPRDLREWLHKLWIAKPTMRELIWKGACLSLNAEKWSACMSEICAQHHLPSPLDDEKHPVGTGSNPVFLISDYVIKIYVEGGLESSMHCLGTELQFYHLLQKVKSPLIDHVPSVLASGILQCENGCYQAHPWDGKGVPDVIAKSNLVKGDFGDDEFSFGVWSKKKFELHKTRTVSSMNTWPYIVIKRCKGDIFANVKNVLSRDDVLHLASFLGDQLRNIHLLPLPQFQVGLNSKIHEMSLTQGTYNDFTEDSGTPAANLSTEMTSVCFRIPQDWELIIMTMQDRRKDIKDRLTLWGAPIPDSLIDKVEEYIPPDPTMLLDLIKEDNGVFKVIGSPTWIHSDIMDDNVHMEQYNTALGSDEIAVDARSTVNGTLDACNAKVIRRKWLPTHILDFSDMSIGDPLYDLIPIHLDIFKGDAHLLKQFLESYRLPLARGTSNHDVLSCRQVEQQQKFRKLSYRAMCYCILHEENILGAIFSLWKELKSAKTWEQVEETVWGELNNYQGSHQ